MKVYTNYGNFPMKALESCLIEIEHTSEWSNIQEAFKKLIEEEKELLKQVGKWDWLTEERVKEYEKSLKILEKAYEALQAVNTISLSEFNVKNIKKGLWKRED